MMNDDNVISRDFKNDDTITTDNLIIITGGSYNDIKTALLQWIELYACDLAIDSIFELYHICNEKYAIKVDNRIDNEKFYFLVNYLYYPEGIKYNIHIEGYTTVFGQKEFHNKKLLIYISDRDTEYDNVFAVTEDNETFKIGFNGKITKVEDNKTYESPNILLSNPEIIQITKRGITKKREEKSKNDVEKQFRLGSLIVFGLLLVSLLILLKNTETFFKATLFLGLGISVWFFEDYKMLRISKYYLYCLFIAIIFLGYGIMIKQIFRNMEIALLDLGSLFPISLLLVQKPLRFIFKTIFKREPIVDKPPIPLEDFIYEILLFLCCAILPLAIFKF